MFLDRVCRSYFPTVLNERDLPMKLTHRLKAAAALAALAVMAACAKPQQGSRAEMVEKEVDAVFGKVSRDANGAVYNAYDDDMKGMFMFRGFSELPFPHRYFPRPGESYGNALVVDFAIDFQEVNGYPLYRIGVRPRKIGFNEVRTLPSFVTINSTPADGPPSRLVAQLPQSRALDENGFIWSDLTYCSDCFDLRRIKDASVTFDESAFELVDRGLAAAVARSGGVSGFEGVVSFIGYAEEGILWGNEARQMSVIAASEVEASRSSLEMVAPSRDTYFRFAKEYAGQPTAARRLLSSCGDYAPSTDPETAEAAERARFEGFSNCYVAALEAFDKSERLSRVEELIEEEQVLARAGAIGEKNRIKVSTFGEEMAAAYAIIQGAADRFDSWAAGKSTDTDAGEAETVAAGSIEKANIGGVNVAEEGRRPASTATAVPGVETAKFPDGEEHDDYEIDRDAAVDDAEVELDPAGAETPVETQGVASKATGGEDVGAPLCVTMMLCPPKQ